MGIARTFQNIRLFGELSVLDNVLVGFHCRSRATWGEAVLRLPRYRREERTAGPGAWRCSGRWAWTRPRTSRPASCPTATSAAWRSPGPWPRGPGCLLLDEPAAGLNPQETMDLMDFIREIKERYGLTMLIIEHNLRLVMGLCQHLTVLDHGLTIAAGAPAEVRRTPGGDPGLFGEVSG